MESTPQLEDGYTRIANELVEAMARGCPGFTEGQIIFCILRKTYGWNKKSDKISISQLVEMTGKSRRMIIYALQNLEAKKMITVVRSFQHINEITLNKNHAEWKPEAKSNQYQKLHLVQHIAPSATFSTSLVQHSVNNIPKVAPTKDTIQKTITKEREFSHIEDISEIIVIEIAEKYQVSPEFVWSKLDDIRLWHEENPKRNNKKNWKATLMKWVKKDSKGGGTEI